MTDAEGAALKYLDEVFIKHKLYTDRFIVSLVDAKNNRVYGQLWDYSSNPETPSLTMQWKQFAELSKTR